LDKSAAVSLDIHNTKGQKVIILVNQQLERGTQTYIWDEDDENGNLVGSGVYFYKL